MQRIIIFGNSGSGKSTLAQKLSKHGLAHLDLDTLAWDMNPDPVRKVIDQSQKCIQQFTSNNSSWVIEGCYADLIQLVIKQSTEIFFMNLSVEKCIENAKRRPWEPHKYESKQKQDDNLNMLIEWISTYSSRKDTFSEEAHKTLYDNYQGQKQMITNNTNNFL